MDRGIAVTVAVLRQAGPEDAGRLHALMEEFYLQERLAFGPEPAAAAAAVLADATLGRVWLIEAPGEDVGYLALTWGYSLEFGGPIGLVDELYVREAHRGLGLGRRALEAAAAACRAAGARAVRLEVDHGNHRAARLYSRAGFALHERHIMTNRLDV